MLLETQDPELFLAASLYALILLVFTLGFLVNWYRNREAISVYTRVGLKMALIVLGFEAATVLLGVTSLSGLFLSGCLVLVSLGWLIIRVWAFVNNGIFFCNKLGIRSFPLLAPKLGVPEPQPVSVEGTSGATAPSAAPPIGMDASVAGTDPPLDLAQLEAQSTLAEPIAPIMPNEPLASSEGLAAGESLPADQPPLLTSVLPSQPPALDRKRYVRDVLVVGLGAVVYTVVLFLVTLPRAGAVARDLSSDQVNNVSLLALVVIAEFAVVEELMFRLGIQNYLASIFVHQRHGYWIAIVLTSIVWTLGHVGSLDPNWVKMAQIFPIGLALGWLFRRHGAESTILAHGLFNLMAAFVATPLYLR
jgi:membrane protease YdiL (CAAX protease family)